MTVFAPLVRPFDVLFADDLPPWMLDRLALAAPRRSVFERIRYFVRTVMDVA
jgi:hypothetical protein